MRIGTLYDTAKRYLPELSSREFVMFYNQALEKLSYDYNIAETVATFTGDDVTTIPSLATKILDIQYDGISLPRIMKR